MRKIQRLAAAALTVVLLSGFAMTDVPAASVISSASIRVEVKVDVGGDLPGGGEIKTNGGLTENETGVAVYTSSSKCYVDQIDWISDTKNVRVGDTPKMKVYLTPEQSDSHYFKGSYGSSNITIKGGTYISCKKEDEQLVVTLKINPIKGNYDPPEQAVWKDSALGRATWDDSRDNTSKTYDAYLYKGSSIIKKVEGLRATSYNFYPYMTKAGSYSFKVRTVPYTESEKASGKKSDWVESDEMYLSEDHVSNGSGQTNDTEGGTVGWIRDGSSWYYRFPDGSYQKDSWFQVNGKWYLFDSSGRMLTGWQTKGSNTFLLKESGEMCTGWYQKDNFWYYLNEQPGSTEGIVCKDSWISVHGKWYLLDSSGRMMTGWQTKNNNSYYLNSSGDLFKGWLKIGSQWYYLCETQTGQFPEGALCKNSWIQANGKTYYINQSGVMAEGWNEVNGNWYYFYPNEGHKAVNTKIGDFTVDGDGIWHR